MLSTAEWAKVLMNVRADEIIDLAKTNLLR
jgi:hypothetical protein